MTSFNEGPNNLSEKTMQFLEKTCVFCQPWWLNAVSPDAWGITTIKRGDEVAAIWPYTFKKKLNHFYLQDLPLIYSYYGPWFRESRAKYAQRLSDEKDLLFELIGSLPKFATFNQWAHHSFTNWLPLFWREYNAVTRYTYTICKSLTIDQAWDGMLINIRGDIRKARNCLKIVESKDISSLQNLLTLTFSRQGLSVPIPLEMLRRVHEACQKNSGCKMLLALDSSDKVHAGLLLVYDEKTVYAIVRGSDPTLRSSGANALLVWEAIEFALSQKKDFDFCGSWIESIERFVRAFGAQQIPFFEISQKDSLTIKSYRLINQYIRGKF